MSIVQFVVEVCAQLVHFMWITQHYRIEILYSWFRASWLYINKIQRDATVCRCLFIAKLLHMFRVSIAPIIRSISNCNCSFWYTSYHVYQKLQLQFDVLLMMGAIDTRNMWSNFAVNKHLHTVASRWILLTFRQGASCILGKAFHYSPENAFYIFNQQIYFIIWYLLDRASLI